MAVVGSGEPGIHAHQGKEQHPSRCGVAVSLLSSCGCRCMLDLLGHVRSACIEASSTFSQLLRQCGRQYVSQSPWNLCSEECVSMCTAMGRSHEATGVVRRWPATPLMPNWAPPCHACDAGLWRYEYASHSRRAMHRFLRAGPLSLRPLCALDLQLLREAQ